MTVVVLTTSCSFHCNDRCLGLIRFVLVVKFTIMGIIGMVFMSFIFGSLN